MEKQCDHAWFDLNGPNLCWNCMKCAAQFTMEMLCFVPERFKTPKGIEISISWTLLSNLKRWYGNDWMTKQYNHVVMKNGD